MKPKRFLLDTHASFWAVFEKTKLSKTVRTVVDDPETEIFASQVSLWEIAIKYRLGKFPEFTVDLNEFIDALSRSGFDLLPIKNEHLIAYFNYSRFIATHNDPFDRLLLVTADVEQAAFITKDEKFNAYKSHLQIIW